MAASNKKGLEKRIERLSPMKAPSHLEDEAKSLFEETCCGSRPLWPLDEEALKGSEDLRHQFRRLVHEGMWAAQERFLHRIDRGDSMSSGEEALYRTAMDSIAWQMIGGQLCYARRLYRDQRQPSLSNSNLESVIGAARYFRAENPDSMPLISDLTNFVQIGDLFAANPKTGISILEVKEGRKNHEIGQLAQFYRQSKCEHLKQLVAETESAQTFKQFQRIVRQMNRMDFASKVLGKGQARDPDSEEEIFIPEAALPIEQWDDRLNKLFDEACERGWAVDVIDDCLFVGAYSAEHMRRAGHIAFVQWLDQFAGDEFSPTARLIDSVTLPLALPIFAVPTTSERTMDVLFGRLHVCMGMSIPGLVEACEKSGYMVRPPKGKKERATTHPRGESITYKGEPLVLERSGKVMFPAKGIFMRSTFHFQRPMAVVNALFESS